MTIKRLALWALLTTIIVVFILIWMTSPKVKGFDNLIKNTEIAIEKCKAGPHQAVDSQNIVVPKAEYATVDIYIDKSSKNILREQRYYQNGKVIAVDYVGAAHKTYKREIFDYYKDERRLRVQINYDDSDQQTQIAYFDENGNKLYRDPITVLPSFTGGY